MEGERVGDGEVSEAARDARAAAQRMALISLVGGAVFLAVTPILVRLSELEPTATALYRIVFALPALLLWRAVEAGRPLASERPAGASDYWTLIVTGAFFAADLVIWYWSVKLTSIANATLLGNMAPIYAVFAGHFFFGERFTKTLLFGTALALAGAVVLMGESVAVDVDNFLGDVLSLVAAGLYAGYIIGLGRLRRRFSSATVLLWTGAITAVLLVPCVLVSGDSLVAETAIGWAVLIALALVSHVGGHGLLAHALRHLPAVFSTVGLLLQPVFAVVLAWFVLSEAIGGRQAAGAAVVMAGIWLAHHGSRGEVRR